MPPSADNPTPAENHRLSFKWFALALALLLGVRFNDVLFGVEAFTLRDFSMFGYPLAAHLQRSLFAGELPLWNTLNQAGTPFLAQWNTMALYPPMLLAALLPLSWSLSVFCIAHQFLGGLGAWRLAFRFTNDRTAAWLAGAAYAGHGLVQNSLMWPNNIAAFGLLPWVLLWTEAACRERGRSFFAATLVGGLQMLTGGPEVILLTWVTAAGLIAVQAWHQAGASRETALRLATFAGLVGAVALLAAAQLLPFAQLLQNCHREAGFNGDHWAASAMAWANLFVPLFATIEAPGRVFYHHAQGWTHSYYAGLPVLALACAAPFLHRDRRVWIAAGGALLFLVIAMGNAGGIYPWIGQLPPFSLLRFPVKFLIPLAILLPVLAAIGFASLRKTETGRLRVVLILMLIGWGISFWVGFGNDRVSRADYLTNGAVRLLLFTLVAVLLSARLRGRSPTALAMTSIAVIAVDLQIHQPSLAPTIPAHQYTATIPALEELRAELNTGPSRAALTSYAIRNLNANSLASKEDTLLLDRLALFGDCNLIDGHRKVNGFYSLYLKRYREVQTVFHAGDDRPSKPLADFLGVSHVMYYTNMFHWHPRAGAMPLVTGGQRPVFVAESESLTRVASTNFNPRTDVLLPEELRDRVTATAAQVSISNVEPSPHGLRFTAHAPTNALAVIAQAGYPAWHARVNETERPLHRANHAFQAVELPPGESSVELEYRDRHFHTGCFLSAGTLLLCVVGLIRFRRPPRAVT